MNRRDLIKGFGSLPMASPLARSDGAAAEGVATETSSSAISLPDRANFRIEGTFLNAAYTHPMALGTAEAGRRSLSERVNRPAHNWPLNNDRDRAVASYARLINADPSEIAIVPSTQEGENLIGAALGIGPGAGVVTDLLHQSSMLALYGEQHRAGMPLIMLHPKDWGIDYDEFDRALTPEIRLVAVSWISSATGYCHDLKRLCEIAHRKNVLVYADVIQGVGAVPLDVRDSAVDFCCAGMYKWLMADFGAAFLYVRADRLAQLRRVQLGWRGVKSYRPLHGLSDPVAGEDVWKLGTDTAGLFEVSTPNWSGLACAVASLDYIHALGIDRIKRHRETLFGRLLAEMPQLGFTPITPAGHRGSFLTFCRKGVARQHRAALTAAGIDTTLSDDSIRIAPSVYTGLDDIDRLMTVLSASPGGGHGTG